MNAQGYAIIDAIMHPQDITELKATIKVRRQELVSDGSLTSDFDDRFDIPFMASATPIMTKVACHPVSNWIMRRYMNVPSLHFSHFPILAVMRPAKKLRGERPEGGWHADYPYRDDFFEGNAFPEGLRLGVQCNICVDEFRPGNAGTQYIPNSHLNNTAPRADLNVGGTFMGTGAHKDVVQVHAPAGSAFIYDSKMWHRAAPELNESGADRVAILHAVTPSWIMPMMLRSNELERFQASPVREKLTKRELDDADAMLAFHNYQAQMAHKRKVARENRAAAATAKL
jgi:hypothetical protein